MKKFTTILLSSVMLCGAVFGASCSNGGDNNVVEEEIVLMNGFEDFSAHIQNIKLINGFGQVNPNRDAKYVKSGKQSIQLRPNGYNYVPARPLICIPTFSVQYDYAFANFSDVKKVLVSAYNAEEKPINMGISLSYAETVKTGLRDEQKRGTAEYFTLQPGWNELEYSVIPAYMESVAESNKFIPFKISEVYGICFDFDYVGAMKIEDAPTVYLDDIYLVKHGKGVSEEEKYGKIQTLKSDAKNGVWEVCDFEDTMQRNFWASSGTYFCQPVLNVVSGVECGITPKSGMNMLQWTQKRGVATGGSATTFLGGAPLRMAFENIGEDIVNNPQNYVYKVDIYNDSKVTATFGYYTFRTADDKVSLQLKSLVCPAKSWVTFEANFKTIDNGVEKEGSYVENPGYFAWVTSDFRTESNNEDRVLYIDNVRIERIANDS